MKGNHWALAATVALLTVAGQVSAGPIELQIDGSDLSVTGGLGVGDYTYSEYASGSFTMAEGDPKAFNFGHVDIVGPTAAFGTVEFTLDIVSPLLGSVLGDIAFFGIISTNNEGLVSLNWGEPTSVGYSYGGAAGGILSLNLYDIGDGFFESFDGGFDLWGTITNVKSPVAVSEPGLLLLLGSGLLTVAATRRRSASRA